MFTLVTPDGCTLQGRIDGPSAESGAQARALVLIVHGLGEHAGRYDHVTRHLVRQRLAVARYDQRGHGRSGGARGALASTDSLLADLGLVIAHLRQAGVGGGLPLVLLGHSMGGLVAACHAAEGLTARPAMWWKAVDALVLSSPALDVGMNALQRALVGLLGPRLPNLALGNGLNPAWVSRDPAVVKAYRDDPLVHNRITPRLARFFLDAGAQVRAVAPHWRVPTLLLAAGADRCVRPQGSAAFAAAAPPGLVTSQVYPGLFHEIFNEPERGQVLADLDDWLDQQLDG
jgi:alpha-beta hydrolase superfamily lysophospholipase